MPPSQEGNRPHSGETEQNQKPKPKPKPFKLWRELVLSHKILWQNIHHTHHLSKNKLYSETPGQTCHLRYRRSVISHLLISLSHSLPKGLRQRVSQKSPVQGDRARRATPAEPCAPSRGVSSGDAPKVWEVPSQGTRGPALCHTHA